ncbi:hypothetical protein EN847_33430, partial [Mesorhizobium sp. M1C.F.Ca.ET.204.01.1.1]
RGRKVDLVGRALDHVMPLRLRRIERHDGAADIAAHLGVAAGLPKLIDALAARGFGRSLIEKIAYRNWLSVLERTIG